MTTVYIGIGNSDEPWQNAEYAATIPDDDMDRLRAELRELRAAYRQDSIAFAVVDRTKFLQ